MGKKVDVLATRVDKFDTDQRNACMVDTDNMTALRERFIAPHARSLSFFEGNKLHFRQGFGYY